MVRSTLVAALCLSLRRGARSAGLQSATRRSQPTPRRERGSRPRAEVASHSAPTSRRYARSAAPRTASSCSRGRSRRICLTRQPEVGAHLHHAGGVLRRGCLPHPQLADARPGGCRELWLVPFEHLRRQLLRQYGDPDQNDTQFPATCEADFAGCVRNEEASATLRWRWDDGHAVMLRIGTTKQVPAAISVSYSDAHGTPAP